MKLSNWIPILKTGTWTDGADTQHVFTEAKLDQMVARYDPAKHEAPAVIGHPKTDGPAWGWVAKLKREGDLLLAQFRDVQPAFADMVAQGLFKKRSIAIYPDLTLRHVGFLGAQPPAVKGLPDAAFGEGTFAEVEVDHTQEEDLMEKKDFTQWLRESLVELGLVKGPEDKKAAEFAEKEQQITAREKAVKEKEEAVANAGKAAAAKTHEAAIGTFCDGLKAAGHLLPAWEKLGLRSFLAALPHESEKALTFAEGGEAITPFAFMQKFLTELPKSVTFGEAAGTDKKTPDAATDPKAWAKAEFAKNRDTYIQIGTTEADLEKIAPGVK